MRPQPGRQLGGQSLVVRRLGQLRPDDLVVVDLLPLDAPERALEDVHGAVRADEQPALVRRLRVLAALFVWKFVPESKGVSLENMQKLWKKAPAA